MKKALFVAIAACCIATTSFAQENWLMKLHMKSGEVKEISCDDVKEVTTNFECGISLQGCNDIKEGDMIETFQEVEVKQKLNS